MMGEKIPVRTVPVRATPPLCPHPSVYGQTVRHHHFLQRCIPGFEASPAPPRRSADRLVWIGPHPGKSPEHPCARDARWACELHHYEHDLLEFLRVNATVAQRPQHRFTASGRARARTGFSNRSWHPIECSNCRSIHVTLIVAAGCFVSSPPRALGLFRESFRRSAAFSRGGARGTLPERYGSPPPTPG